MLITSKTKQPKYHRLIEMIIGNIQCGVYPSGSPLPSETELAEAAQVSVTTVREALKHLVREGVVLKSRGRRSVVNADALPGRKKTLVFGWLTHDPGIRHTPIYHRIYMSLQKRVTAINGHLSFLPLLDRGEEDWVLSRLHTMDGIFLAGIFDDRLGVDLARAVRSMPNTIEIDDIEPSIATRRVHTDNHAAGMMTGRYLLEQGRNAVALCDPHIHYYRGYAERLRGLEEAYARAGKLVPVRLYTPSTHAEDHEREILARCLNEIPDLDTIWSPSDHDAIRLRRKLETLAPRPEGFYRSAGIDGLDDQLADEPYHASAAQPVAEIARRAFAVMSEAMSRQTPEAETAVAPVLRAWTTDNVPAEPVQCR